VLGSYQSASSGLITVAAERFMRVNKVLKNHRITDW